MCVVDLRVRRDAPVEREARRSSRSCPSGLERQRVDAVEVAALVEAGQRGAAVHDHVGARRVLHQGPRAPAVVALGDLHGFGEARPQRAAGLVLGREPVGADEPVAVERFSVPEADDVHHAVAVEGVVTPDRLVQRVLGVAQIDAVEIGGNLALDLEVVGVVLGVAAARRRSGRDGRRRPEVPTRNLLHFDLHDAAFVRCMRSFRSVGSVRSVLEQGLEFDAAFIVFDQPPAEHLGQCGPALFGSAGQDRIAFGISTWRRGRYQ